MSALLSVAMIASPASAQATPPDPAGPAWRQLLTQADAAFEAGAGRVERLGERAAERGHGATPGLVDALDVDARWDHDAADGNGDEIGLDAAVRLRAFGAAEAARHRWSAEAELARADREAARWRYLETFIARYIDASVATGRAEHVGEHLEALRRELAPLTDASNRQMVRAVDRMEVAFEVDRLEAELARAVRARAVAMAALAAWLGDAAPSLAAPPLDLGATPAPDNPWRPLLAAPPCVTSCRSARATAKARDARAALLDTEDDVTVSLGVGWRRESVGPTWLGVLAQVSIPLGHPAADEAAADRGLAQRDLAQAEWQRVLLANRLAEEATRWDAFRAEVEALEARLLAPAEARHDMLLAARRDGFATIEQVIRATRDLLETHDSLLEARSALWDSTLRASAMTRMLSAHASSPATPEVTP